MVDSKPLELALKQMLNAVRSEKPESETLAEVLESDTPSVLSPDAYTAVRKEKKDSKMQAYFNRLTLIITAHNPAAGKVIEVVPIETGKDDSAKRNKRYQAAFRQAMEDAGWKTFTVKKENNGIDMLAVQIPEAAEAADPENDGEAALPRA